MERIGAVGSASDFGPRGPRFNPCKSVASSVAALNKSHFHSSICMICIHVLYVLS